MFLNDHVYGVISQQLEMNTHEKRQLNLPLRRVPVNRDSYTLIIGMGGTGCQALIETKGFIELTCENSRTHVAYIAFDTDQYAMNKLMSSSETGKVKLAEEERVFLKFQNLPGMAEPPEVYDWIDSMICGQLHDGINRSAASIRQVGRLIMMKNRERIRQAIRDAACKLASDPSIGANPFLNVYILTGLCGGTGSAMVIDMPYIIRETLRDIPGFAANSNKIYGYLFMPDVNVSQNHGNEASLNRNAYAALKELDYNLSLQELGEQYMIRYPGGIQICPGTQNYDMYDFVHLVSATSANGYLIPDSFNVSVREVARNILSFVADETAVGYGAAAFAIQSHYNNINGKIYMYELNNATLLKRSAKYLAIGSMSYDLPIDDIMMYMTSLMFERMGGLFENDPTAAEHDAAQTTIGLSAGSIVEAFKTKMPQLVVCKSDKDAFKKGTYVDYQAKAAMIYSARYKPEMMSWLDRIAADIAHEICDRFDAQMSHCFRDRARGPVYANRLIVDSMNGILEAIVRQRQILTYPAGANPEYLFQNQLRAFADAKHSVERIFGKTDENISFYNKTGMELYNCYLCYSLSDRILAIYDKVEEHIRAQNTALYEFVAQTMICLKNVFANNANILTKCDDEDSDGGVFHWDRLTVSKLSGLLQEKFEAIFEGKEGQPGKGDQMIDKFLAELWAAAVVWMKDNAEFNPRAFVSEYISDEFGKMASLTLEDVVLELMNRTGTNLYASVDSELVPKIVNDSAPLFFPVKGMPVGEKVLLISIPAQCPNICNAVQAALPAALNAAGVNTFILQQSSINTRIYAQTVQCGITLAHYHAVWNAEKDYARNRESAGLHLIAPRGRHASKDYVSWKELCTLIPHYLRPIDGIDPAVNVLIEEENSAKDRLKSCIDMTNYTSRHPAVSLQTNPDVWAMDLTITDVRVEFKNGEVRFLCDKKNPVMIQSYNINDADQAERLDGKINEIMKDGLAHVFAADGVQSEVRTINVLTRLHPNNILIERMLEEYIRRVNLVHRFEQEMSKYDALKELMEQISYRG